MANHLELKNITAAYGAAIVLKDFSLQIERGELVALLGASGCGKTTILKIIAGLLAGDAGEVWLDGKNISRVPAEKREISLVFQKPLLFPFLNVAENIGFGLKMRKTPKAVIKEKVAEVLGLVRLEGFADRMPKQLSGGQEQRVALARALVTNPRVLLLDEPFSALDARLRAEMRNLVNQLQRRLKITTVFVTHDQAEAVALADRIAFLDAGNLAQIARPQEFFTNPNTAETAGFFGWTVIEARANRSVIETAIGEFNLSDCAGKPESKQITHLAFYQNRVELVTENFEAQAAAGTIINGKLERVIHLGIKSLYFVRVSGGETLEVEMPAEAAAQTTNGFEVGKTIKIFIPANALRVFFD